MRIDMWLDTCDPWSYLGVRHLRAALEGFVHRDLTEVYLHAFLRRRIGGATTRA